MENLLETTTNEDQLTKRVLCDYSLLDQNIMKLKKQIVLDQLEILRLTGVSIIFENQENIAYRVVSTFKNRKIINIMVVSKTQSGKTGSMCATIKKYLEDSSNLIPIENIYIITGLSSVEWKEQTKERMPESIQNRVFHRCELPNTFVDEIMHKKNVLIIMDEIQVAAKKDQTIYNTFERAGLLNKNKLYENDIKILEYTATPDGTIYDLMRWKDCSEKILGEVGEGYVSSFDLLARGRVKQYKELCGYDKDTKQTNPIVFENIMEIKMDIDNYDQPRYHIIRTKTGYDQDRTIENFMRIFDPNEYDFVKYDKDSDIIDINQQLIIQPERHTFIFIKEMLRCAKTIKKRHIGILYERYTVDVDDSGIIQGLLGRDTGYDNNGHSIIYTNIESIIKYEHLWNSQFEDNSIRWNSKTTKFANRVLQGGNTFNDPTNYDNFSVSSEDTPKSQEEQPIIRKFRTYDEAMDYFRKELKPKLGGRANGPQKPPTNNEGFYMSNIRSVEKVYSCDEMRSQRKQGISNKSKNNRYRLYPCYEDVNDINTIQWWFYHY